MPAAGTFVSSGGEWPLLNKLGRRWTEDLGEEDLHGLAVAHWPTLTSATESGRRCIQGTGLCQPTFIGSIES